MRLSKHERFLQELRAPVKRFQRKQQKRQKKGSGSQAVPVASGLSDAYAGLADSEDPRSIEKLLEEKFDELFGIFNDNE